MGGTRYLGTFQNILAGGRITCINNSLINEWFYVVEVRLICPPKKHDAKNIPVKYMFFLGVL